MLDINFELEHILIRNEIISKTDLEEAVVSIKKFHENLKDGDVIGIYGAGFDADALLHFITGIINDFYIDYCFDKRVKNYSFRNVIKNTDVLTVEQMSQVPVDYMIIGSFQYREELKNNLRERGYKGKIIDVFGLMENYMEEHTSDYRTIYNTRKQYEDSQGGEKEIALKKLIREYLFIRDFDSAFRYIDTYIQNGYDKAEQYISLKKDLEGLFLKIKEQIKTRQQHDIIINWMDALSYSDLKNFPFLQGIADKAVNFKNAYTVNPWTTETMKTLLYGEYSIENKLFLKKYFKTDDTKLLRILALEGYKFAYIGMNKYVKLYDEDTILVPELNFRKEVSSITRQWEALGLLCKEESPLCLMIHTLNETHQPYICGEIEPYQEFTCAEEDWSQEACRIQADVSGRYIDRQLAFYEDFLGENTIRIYMSDHGRITNSIMRESRVHSVLIIDYPGVRHIDVEDIFSLIDFHEIIQSILSGKKDFWLAKREYVLVEALDFYNLSLIKMTKDHHKYNLLEALQRRGIITLKDRYCKFANGRECYFIAGDDKTNRIGDRKYEERVQELRELCGDKFIDINQYDEFKYSKLLYEE